MKKIPCDVNKAPGPKDPALFIPRRDEVMEYWSDGVMEKPHYYVFSKANH